MTEEDFMRRAIQLSEEMMLENNGGPFGAVIVKDGEIIAEGYNQVTSTNDPTAHAEIVAIRNACEAVNSFRLEGTAIYCSCEPCPMCLSAIYWARIHKIYYANTRQDAHQIGFDDDHIFEEMVRDVRERAIPAVRLLPEEGRAAFRAWEEKPDRVPY